MKNNCVTIVYNKSSLKIDKLTSDLKYEYANSDDFTCHQASDSFYKQPDKTVLFSLKYDPTHF